MYNSAIFTNSFPYPSVEISAVVTSIIIIGVVAHRGRNGRLRGKVS